MNSTYPKYFEHLRGYSGKLAKEIPGTMSGFAELHKAATADGTLDTKVKELIALGIAITVRCNGCISYHVHDALKAGASRKEILEAIGVAILMGGGPSMVYGCEALEALEQFDSYFDANGKSESSAKKQAAKEISGNRVKL